MAAILSFPVVLLWQAAILDWYDVHACKLQNYFSCTQTLRKGFLQKGLQ